MLASNVNSMIHICAPEAETVRIPSPERGAHVVAGNCVGLSAPLTVCNVVVGVDEVTFSVWTVFAPKYNSPKALNPPSARNIPIMQRSAHLFRSVWG